MLGIDLKQSFDASASLAALFLWVIFSYFHVLLNCDLQRYIKSSATLRHLLGVIAFYFLFTVIDPNNNVPVWVTLAKTVGVYVIFVLATRSRWYYVGLVLALLFVDQVLKNHEAYLSRNNPDRTLEQRQKIGKVREWLFYTILIVVAVGTIDYYFKQQKEKGKNFQWSIFLLGTNECSGRAT